MRDAGHLLDEVDQAEIEVIFDQREAGDADTGVGAAADLGQRVLGGLLGRRINQDDLAALDVRGRLAVGDHDDLLVRRRLPRQDAPRQSQAGVDIREVLRHAPDRVVEVESQVNPAVEHADRLGSRVDELPLVHHVGERVKADHLQRVLRVARPDHRLQRQRDLLGRVVLAVPAHRPAHVDQDDRRAPGLVLGLVDDIVFRAEPDRHAAPLADVGVLDRLVQVEIGQRVAVDVGPGVLERDGPLAFLGGVVPAERVAAERLEQVVERACPGCGASPWA